MEEFKIAINTLCSLHAKATAENDNLNNEIKRLVEENKKLVEAQKNNIAIGLLETEIIRLKDEVAKEKLNYKALQLEYSNYAKKSEIEVNNVNACYESLLLTTKLLEAKLKEAQSKPSLPPNKPAPKPPVTPVVQVVPTIAPIAPADGKSEEEEEDSEQMEQPTQKVNIVPATGRPLKVKGRKPRHTGIEFEERDDISFNSWLQGLIFTENPTRGKSVGDRIVGDDKVRKYISCLNTLTKNGFNFVDMCVEELTCMLDNYLATGNNGKPYSIHSVPEWTSAIEWYYRYMDMTEELKEYREYLNQKKKSTR